MWKIILWSLQVNSCESVYLQVREYQASFSSYRYLWTDDRSAVCGCFWFVLIVSKYRNNFWIVSYVHRSEFMRQFLLYGHALSTEEAELYADYELKKNPPTLDNFKEQVCSTFVIHLCCNLGLFHSHLESNATIITELFIISDQSVWVTVCASEQNGGPKGVLWLATARYQTLQAHTDECH